MSDEDIIELAKLQDLDDDEMKELLESLSDDELTR